jgi:hypothetical protein
MLLSGKGVNTGRLSLNTRLRLHKSREIGYLLLSSFTPCKGGNKGIILMFSVQKLIFMLIAGDV